jgi:thiosulfate dehydrogenase (quinone) large subunit
MPSSAPSLKGGSVRPQDILTACEKEHVSKVHLFHRSRSPDVSGATSGLPSDQALAYVLLRLTLGVTMVVHGANRIVHGVEQFAAGLDRDFAGTILPAVLVHLFAWILPFIEAGIGALLILGLLTRAALVAGALLMTVLVFGMTLREQFMIVGIQLIYAVIYFVLIYNLRHNSVSLDRFLARRDDECVGHRQHG